MFIYTIGDIIFCGMLAIGFTFIICYSIYTVIQQRLCKHERYGESSQCNAICTNCGANLGFIGQLQERDRKRSELKLKEKKNDDKSNS